MQYLRRAIRNSGGVAASLCRRVGLVLCFKGRSILLFYALLCFKFFAFCVLFDLSSVFLGLSS